MDGLEAASWEELGIDLEGDPMGAGAYHPRALLSIWIYGFMTGVRSSRKLEAACREQIPYMWLQDCKDLTTTPCGGSTRLTETG